MPFLSVPLCRSSSSSTKISISYTLQGHGPVLVVLVPGLCVPSSMYDSVATLLAATGQFTTVAIDNRGIGLSDVPYSSLFGGLGYTVSELAQDAWDVVDHILQSQNIKQTTLRPHVALIGHSMGGMIAQCMLFMRPDCVRYVALLSTHAGGFWNLLPTVRLITSAVRVAWSGFDRDVHAAVNLSLHFTQRFLDDCVGFDDYFPPTITQSDTSTSEKVDSDSDGSIRPSAETHSVKPSFQPHGLQRVQSSDEKLPLTPHQPGSTSLLQNVSFVESKVIDFARDAYIYFGLPVASLPEKFRHPKQFLLDAIAKRAQKSGQDRRRRWDIYHARYTGLDAITDGGDSSLSAASTRWSTDAGVKKDRKTVQSVGPAGGAMEATTAKMSETSSLSTHYGHLAVVRSHSLSYRFARALRHCSAIVKLVVIGRHDNVITPSSSRALANSIDANTVLELDAAHFVTDEAAAEVTTQIVYGLRKAFFAPVASVCKCEWCKATDDENKLGTGNCYTSSCLMS